MGVILSWEVGGTIHGIIGGRRKNYCITPFFAQCLLRYATSKLGLTKRITSESKSGGGGTKHSLSPGGKKVGGGTSPTKLRPRRVLQRMVGR